MDFLPNKKKSIAIIGAGGIVKDAHLPAYQNAGFDVAVIYDLNKEKAEILAEQFNISKAAQTLDEFHDIANEKDCVFDLAVPANAILDVLSTLPDKSGVLIQKPLGENLTQAKKIFNLCEKKEITAGVNFQLRQAPFICQAKQMIETGEIGELHDIDIKMTVYTPWHLWDFLYELPRVEILYHSVHYIDLVRYFFGNPKSVYARTIKHPKMKDLASTKSNIYMDYGKLKRAAINTNHGHDFGPEHQESYIKFEGTQGAIKIQVGVNLDYPKGREDQFEYNKLSDQKGWQRKEIDGSWFPDAFIGPMAGLMKKLEDPHYEYPNSISDAVETMKVVETAYLSSEKDGRTINE
ncbi:Gfo/Idh/MocA family protein [Rhodohalobacter sulfatireducens]|uniref:Gfo/Idh/MocA family oxidoreductase n=1 Tax=Rhodohalobacter sulfatireducens TaxID=2911366 RepID=A0ABS9KHZ8_9BACT|nr:Gfo/Idh/MocA family oxidoreductase [Rhodohalobacter sulfatireducens]MCG2590451.1 Gfo/Idh/MocA family oxidoreductase [Rhodohalobacter sulfatireducens]